MIEDESRAQDPDAAPGEEARASGTDVPARHPGRDHVARYHRMLARMYAERGQIRSARFEEETARLIA